MIIKIGSYDTPLNLWQANAVSQMLDKLGHRCEIVVYKASEKQEISPSTLLIHKKLLDNHIDLAVNSFTDFTEPFPEKIIQVAILKRGNFKDVLIFKKNEEFLSQQNATILIENARQKAQWLNRYPSHNTVQSFGNIYERLEQLNENTSINAGIFSASELGRLNLKPKNAINLDWMIPTPAQGSIVLTSVKENDTIAQICHELNHAETEICIDIERAFFKLLNGDNHSAIGALAFIKDEEIHFKGVFLSSSGTKKIEITRIETLAESHKVAPYCANFIIDRGGNKLVDLSTSIKENINVYSTKTLTKNQSLLFNENVVSESSDFIKISVNRIKPQIIRAPIKNVIISDKHTAEALLHNFSKVELQFQNIYCVGRRTKRFVSNTIGEVKKTEKSDHDLITHLIDHIDGDELIYFGNEPLSDDLQTMLQNHNVSVQNVKAYDIKYDDIKIKDSIEGVLFFSPLAVHSYLKQNHSNNIAFCFGNSTAVEAKKHFKDVRVAKTPTINGMIDIVNEHFM